MKKLAEHLENLSTMIKTAMTAEKALQLAKSVGIIPVEGSSWRWAVKQLRSKNPDRLKNIPLMQSGRELAKSKERLGMLTNNEMQTLRSAMRRYGVAGHEIGLARNSSTGKVRPIYPDGRYLKGAVNLKDVGTNEKSFAHIHPSNYNYYKSKQDIWDLIRETGSTYNQGSDLVSDIEIGMLRKLFNKKLTSTPSGKDILDHLPNRYKQLMGTRQQLAKELGFDKPELIEALKSGKIQAGEDLNMRKLSPEHLLDTFLDINVPKLLSEETFARTDPKLKYKASVLLPYIDKATSDLTWLKDRTDTMKRLGAKGLRDLKMENIWSHDIDGVFGDVVPFSRNLPQLERKQRIVAPTSQSVHIYNPEKYNKRFKSIYFDGGFQHKHEPHYY